MKKILLSAALLLSGVSLASAAEVTDHLTSSLFAATNTTYTAFSDVSATSTAIYAGKSAKAQADNGGGIQLRSNKNEDGIVSITSGGTIVKVSLEWGTGNTNGRTLNIYGSNEPYTSATELYGSSLKGTLLGTIVYTEGEPTELEISGSYEYIGLRSNSGAMYINWIDIVWEEAQGEAPSVKRPSINANGGKEFFDDTEILIEAEEGTTIYYTTNKELADADPIDVSKWNVYTSTFEVSESCVVYAVAKKDSDISEVAFITLTKNPTVATLADLPEATTTGVDIRVTGPVVVVGNFTSKGYLYVKDLNSDVYMRLYDQTKKTPAYQPGEKLSNIKFVYSLYNATPQGAIASYLSDYPTPTTEEIPAADVPQPVVTTEWGALNVYAKFENVQPYTDEKNNTYFDLGEDKIQIYAGLGIAMTTFEEGCYYDVLGYTLNYNTTKEIYFAGASQSITPEPVISFTKNEGITFTGSDNAALSEDVKVYYTILSEKDLAESALETLANPEAGVEGTIEWDGNVIATDNATVIKAIAVKTGYAASEVAKFYVAQENATGVAMLEAADTDAEIYDLNGRRINGNTLEKGIYIVRTAGKAVKVIK